MGTPHLQSIQITEDLIVLETLSCPPHCHFPGLSSLQNSLYSLQKAHYKLATIMLSFFSEIYPSNFELSVVVLNTTLSAQCLIIKGVTQDLQKQQVVVIT